MYNMSYYVPIIGRNLEICNHPICDYMWLCVVCNYLPISPNLGRVYDYITTNVWLLFFRLISLLQKWGAIH